MARFVILDFDGTVTRSEEEGKVFTAAYVRHLSALANLDESEVAASVDAWIAEMLADPAAHPFLFQGRPVAPAAVDPYLRMGAAAERLFDRAGIFRDPADRGRLLGGLLYPLNYQLTVERPIFRDDALDVFTALADQNLHIVTNSKTHHVAEKIRVLSRSTGDEGRLAWLAARARGDARKFVIEDDFAAVPAGLSLPGLGRDVLLRRRHYHDVLDTIRREHGAAWTDGWVVGDIFELDLALPLALGMNVVLVAGPSTPAYERAFVARHGHVVDRLGDVLGLLGLAGGPEMA